MTRARNRSCPDCHGPVDRNALRCRSCWRIYRAATVDSRFWERVDWSGGVDSCWIWHGAKTKRGHGRLALGTSQSITAHRYAYERVYGVVSRKIDIHHRCEIEACCNPLHLVALTRQEHVRGDRRGNPTHCRHGHPYTAENTRWQSDGSRCCIICRRISEQRRRDKRRLAG